MINEERLVQDITAMKADIADLKIDKVTKSDIQEIVTSIDRLTKVTLDVRSDYAATIEWLKRHDRQIEKHDKDIKEIKLELRTA